ncbi:hypothetical protein PAPHI01_1471 [Pancytospora philotis]|nr:hypothetical protein PAPHI01_1471 [Pancytospora philotis]
MFREPLDIVETIGWAEGAPRHTERRSKFLQAHRESVAPEQPAEMLSLPPPSAKAEQGSLGCDNSSDRGGDAKQIEKVARRSPLALLRRTLPGAGMAKVCRAGARLLNPALIIGYIHTLLNMFVLFAVVYIFGHLLYFITTDVLYKIHSKKEEARALIAEAGRLYQINRCDPTTRVPALEGPCGEWDHVVRNGLKGIKYTKIVVEICADVLDGFITKFSMKSYGFISFLLIVYLIFRR